MEGKEGKNAGGGGDGWYPGVPLSVRCNASERANAGQLTRLPPFDAAIRLGSFANLVRVGQRKSRRGWYGCNSAVYECSVVNDDDNDGGAGGARPAAPQVAMKVIYNAEEVQTVDLAA